MTQYLVAIHHPDDYDPPKEGEAMARDIDTLNAMRAATRERMISIVALMLVISIGFLVPKAAAQSDKYSKMAPVDQYLMERNAEILLAASG